MNYIIPPLHKPSGYQICTKTIMDTSDPEILFDDAGVSNHYHEYKKLETFHVYAGKETDDKFGVLVEQIKQSGKKNTYDCLIGLSGGVDSSYVAYIAKKCGLRALTMHFDNGWNSELAVKNIEHILTKLQFDYETWVVDWEEFRDLQTAFLKASVANAETPTDHAFLGALYRTANKYNIKYILSGSNYVTEAILPKSWGYNAKDLKHLKAIHKQFGTIPLKTFPTLGFTREFYFTYVKGIRMLRFLHYVPYVKSDAMKILQDELGWVYYGGKHYESIFTRFFQAYILPKKFGFDKRRAHFSTLIASGQITRDEALIEMEREIYPVDMLRQDKEYAMKKLGITREEFETILKLPNKSYRDYPNDEKRLKFIYSVYNKLLRRK